MASTIQSAREGADDKQESEDLPKLVTPARNVVEQVREVTHQVSVLTEALALLREGFKERDRMICEALAAMVELHESQDGVRREADDQRETQHARNHQQIMLSLQELLSTRRKSRL